MRLPENLSRYRSRAAVAAACLAFIGLMWAGVMVALQVDRTQAIESRQRENDNLIRVFAENVTRTIRAADITLDQMVSEYQRRGKAFDLVEYAKMRGLYLDPATALGISDETGDVILANLPVPTPVNFNRTSNHQYHARHDTPDIFISESRLGANTKKWTVFLSRRINKADGSFGGTAIYGLDATYLTNLYKEIDLGADSLFNLTGRDGIVRAREDLSKFSAGQDLSGSMLFTRDLPAADHGGFIRQGAFDQVTRIFSYRALKNYPLVVSIGTSLQVALAGYEARKSLYTNAASALTAIVLGFGRFATRMIGRNERANEGLRQSEARLADAQRTAQLGSWDLDLVSNELVWSDEIYRIFEIAPTGFGASYEAFLNAIHPDDRAMVDKAYTDSVANRTPYQVVHRLAMPDGRVKWVEERCQTWHDNAGRPLRSAGTVQDITETVLTEQRLTRERQFTQSLRDAAPVIILLLSPEGTIQLVNRYFENLTGWGLDEIRGKDWFTAFVPEHRRNPNHTRFENATPGAPDYRKIYPIVTRGGEEREIEWAETPVPDQDGRPGSVLAVGLDVTESRKHEAERARQHKRMRDIFDGVFIFIGMFTVDGVVIETNRAPLEAAGLTSGEVFGKPFWDTYFFSYSPEIQAELRRLLARAASGESVRADLVARLAENSFFTFDVMFAPLRGPDGHITEIVGSGVDITVRKQAEQELLVSKSQLVEAQTIAGIGSWDLDLVSNQLVWSEGMFRICEIDQARFGASYDAFLAMVHPDDLPLIHKASADSLASHTPYQLTHRLIMADGRVKWLEERGRAWYDSSGQPYHFAGTAQDITQIVLVEQQLRRSVAEKDTLLREIHHRVKNNLQIIASLLYFQARKVKDPGDLAAITDGSERLRAMILVHEKLYQSAELTRIDFGGYLRSLVRQLAESQAPRGQRITTRVEAGGDAVPLEIAQPCGMIVCELLLNAFKYAFPDGSDGEVTVQAVKADDRMTMTVGDNGVGLPEDFDTKAAGSFGWQLINTLVTQIGGTIAAASGAGTTVSVSFPVPEEVQ